ncbi:MAG: DNA-cytosine methyltransferase [Amycolatopsis sp.]|jgi:DNA (cytosine-5)-methyltransferase 1|uniref:DNA cytosine methyltransferase n=1 Tax=Amycolatopsis sp. TaxID=37632 RepID=UPI0026198F9D|nr:DNA (cytosine-5-)-methyltransferase [Amycolatopsis sp.]MCU1684635.1 DNA-cytosine methyltransferase [Amycolatopsis sp.]
MSETFEVIEICAGAGGQALGLEKAGFTHKLAVELDANACETLRANLPNGVVAEGDVADRDTWKPEDYAEDKENNVRQVSLLAGGVPCPPFTIAGKQLGANDERDLFAWAVEQVEVIRPRALLLENVRGLSMPRFAGYRQHVLDRLTELNYVAEWKLLHASGFGVPQLRPRFVLVAMEEKDAKYFSWPEESNEYLTVGKALEELMNENKWAQLKAWVKKADNIGPTIVGGSKKHGGADLGPTRAKKAWQLLGVDAHGVANEAPGRGDKFDLDVCGPKLTNKMVARIQGWSSDYPWKFTGKKTSLYRQIGNAFPPPMAHKIGESIISAFKHEEIAQKRDDVSHDAIYKALREAGDFIEATNLIKSANLDIEVTDLENRVNLLRQDFEVEIEGRGRKTFYKLGDFKAFTGQKDHARHESFLKNRAKIS